MYTSRVHVIGIALHLSRVVFTPSPTEGPSGCFHVLAMGTPATSRSREKLHYIANSVKGHRVAFPGCGKGGGPCSRSPQIHRWLRAKVKLFIVLFLFSEGLSPALLIGV